jgi:Zn/Cd-binding protein ZinT
MNNINIKNIFIDDNVKNEDCVNTLNVYNLVESKIFSNNLDDEYIINKIKNNDKKEKNKTKDLYETKYKECLNKINNAIDLKLMDIFFIVGDNFFGYNNYTSIKCLEYIQNKLRKKNFETLICSNKQLFISWKNVIDSLN